MPQSEAKTANIKLATITELLYTLQKFNKLDKRIVGIIGEVFGVDARQICSENGIVYWL